jgi:polar amino acid transport system substrate-binding protein
MRFALSWRAGLALLAVLALIGGGALWWLSKPAAPKDALEALKARGFVNIGVRADAPPFSALDGSRIFSGYEPDIGRALASSLGVQPRFVLVDAQTAAKLLGNRAVDFIIAPHNGLGRGGGAIRSIEPGYFASGLIAITLSVHPLLDWDDLRGASVCGLESGTPAARTVQELGGQYIGFADVPTGLKALAAERCRAFVGDEIVLGAATAGDLEHQYVTALEAIDPAPWVVTVRAGDPALGDAIGVQLAAWHRSGFLIRSARAWHLPESPYLGAMRSYYAE